MKIEEAINQQHFKNNWQKATLNILYTNNWMHNKIKTFLKPYGITQQQFNVLRILRGQFPNPLTTSVIRERMLDKMSDASRIVERLCKKGLVEREVCSADKRLVDVLISSKGLDILSEIDKHSAFLDFPSTSLTEEEALQLSDLLDKMRGAGH
jgi:DNA-binding MarR family transcriptional regulator